MNNDFENFFGNRDFTPISIIKKNNDNINYDINNIFAKYILVDFKEYGDLEEFDNITLDNIKNIKELILNGNFNTIIINDDLYGESGLTLGADFNNGWTSFFIGKVFDAEPPFLLLP